MHMKVKQQKFNLYKGARGGRRPGSGRKRVHSKGVAHRQRETVNRRAPLHINFKFRTQIRNKLCLRLLKRAILNSRPHGLKVIHFSLQYNHVHLIVEAESNAILTTGMRSLTVSFAKGLKMGKVQMERYHLHVLKSVQETRTAVLYVLFNKQKHEKGTYSKIDEYSSILMMENALEVIRNFAKNMKITIEVGKAEDWELDKSRSYLLSKALTHL